MHVAITGINRK